MRDFWKISSVRCYGVAVVVLAVLPACSGTAPVMNGAVPTWQTFDEGIERARERGRYLLHLSGFVDAHRLVSVLRYVASESYERESSAGFVERISEHEIPTPERY